MTSTRLPELMSTDRSALDALLDTTVVAHVAFVESDGAPAIMPTAVARWGDELLVHGSTGSRWMRLLGGAPAAVSIATVDGVIVARSAFESSLAYRSAILTGAFRKLSDAEKLEALDALTGRLIPGRPAEVRPSTPKELAATLVLAMPITDWTLRISDGWPEDTADDMAGPAWAGRIDFGPRPTVVLPAPDLRPGTEIPASVAHLGAAH